MPGFLQTIRMGMVTHKLWNKDVRHILTRMGFRPTWNQLGGIPPGIKYSNGKSPIYRCLSHLNLYLEMIFLLKFPPILDLARHVC